MKGWRTSLANRLLHVYYLFSLYVYHFLVFRYGHPSFSCCCCFCPSKTMCSRRVIEAIIIIIIIIMAVYDCQRNRRLDFDCSTAAAALTGEMLMEYADLSEERPRKEEKLTSYLSPRNNILRLPVSHMRGWQIEWSGEEEEWRESGEVRTPRYVEDICYFSSLSFPFACVLAIGHAISVAREGGLGFFNFRVGKRDGSRRGSNEHRDPIWWGVSGYRIARSLCTRLFFCPASSVTLAGYGRRNALVPFLLSP